MKEIDLKSALENPAWVSHRKEDRYTMDGQGNWKITYYPIFQNGKTQELYNEPRALVEQPMKGGIDFREVPLRYLNKITIS